MTVVDVNTGKFTGSGGNLEETVTKNNLEAAEEIVRQLRLRDIGGIIVVDFIDMVLESNRDLVLRRLVECLGRDRTRHQVAEVTSLGLVQMTRKRIGTGLLEAFSETASTARAAASSSRTRPVEPQAGRRRRAAAAAAGAAAVAARRSGNGQRQRPAATAGRRRRRPRTSPRWPSTTPSTHADADEHAEPPRPTRAGRRGRSSRRRSTPRSTTPPVEPRPRSTAAVGRAEPGRGRLASSRAAEPASPRPRPPAEPPAEPEPDGRAGRARDAAPRRPPEPPQGRHPRPAAAAASRPGRPAAPPSPRRPRPPAAAAVPGRRRRPADGRRARPRRARPGRCTCRSSSEGVPQALSAASRGRSERPVLRWDGRVRTIDPRCAHACPSRASASRPASDRGVRRARPADRET